MITAATHLDSTQLRLRAARHPFYAGMPDQTTNGDRAERHCRSPTTVRRPSLRIFTQTRGAENQYRRGRVRLMRHCYQMGLSVLVVFYFARHDKRKAAPRRPQARRRRSTTVAVRQTSAQRVGRRGRIWFKTENKNGPIGEGGRRRQRRRRRRRYTGDANRAAATAATRDTETRPSIRRWAQFVGRKKITGGPNRPFSRSRRCCRSRVIAPFADPDAALTAAASPSTVANSPPVHLYDARNNQP